MIMEPEQPAQPLPGSYRSIFFPDAVYSSGKQDHVVVTLVVSFRVQMRNVLGKRVSE